MEELRRVPHTRLRFVTYVGEEYDSSSRRGYLDNAVKRVPSREQSTARLTEEVRHPRVASAHTIFCNMIHEGLVFLHLLVHGCLRLNPLSEPLPFQEDEEVIVSLFYSNDVLVIFSALLSSVLTMDQVLRRYSLPLNINFSNCWSCGTPEAVSGDTVLLSQT
eukprot:1733997-Karenia_brevis.AAC.1